MIIRTGKSIVNGLVSILPFFLILGLLFTGITAKSQYFEGFPEFGSFSAQERDLKNVDFEPDASAVILQDLAFSTYDDQHHLITRHRVRIKILNDKGLDRANISLPYSSRNEFEYLSDIKAVIATYDNNNIPVTTSLDRKSIFDVKMNEYYSQVKFTMPDVKVGSIIEYEYQSTMKHYGGLEDWDFQSDIPTIKSNYKLDILPIAEFAYRVYKLSNYPIKIDSKTPGTIKFEMQNIPGLHEEPYMDARNDNLQKVTFQLSAINNTGYKSKYLTSWDDVAKELLSHDGLGGQLKKQIPGTDDFIKQTKALPSEMERLKAVYKYVQQKISWNGYTSKYSGNGVKKAWEKGSGTDGEINLIFVNMLNDVNINAVPLLASDRQHMKVELSYPFVDQFNKVVAYVYLKDDILVIDASNKTTPIHLIPYSLLNTYGYVLDKKKKGLVLLENPALYYENDVSLFTKLKEDGTLDGYAIINSNDYSRQERKEFYTKNSPEKFLEKYFSSSFTNLKADSLEVLNINNDSLPLLQTASFKQTLNSSGDYSFLNYHLFTGLDKNPFKNDSRFSDVNFGSPQRYKVSQTIELPDNYIIDALPKNISMMTPDTSLVLKRVIEVKGKEIVSQLKLEINSSYFEKTEYPYVKEFYKKMYAYLDEQIVLKRKQ